MAKKQNRIIRFAFGTIENPSSSVWRVNVVGGKGDVYINNIAQLGNSVHVALHAAGIFHFKLGSETRHDMAPPWTDPNGLICGPAIFFYQWEREIPPPKPSGKTKLIKWLGWPSPNHVVIVRTYYCERHVQIKASEGETIIDGPIEACLFDRKMNFYLILEHRKMTREELAGLETQKIEELKFKGNIPDEIEMIRVSKTPQGPAAIILERFNATVE